MANRKRMALRNWQQLIGELRSVLPALLGSRGLFSLFQPLTDLRAVQEAIASGVTASRAHAASSAWKLWVSFSTSLHLDPQLPSFQDKISVLQIFAHRYRHGTISPSRQQVRSCTVEDAVRQIAQTYSSLGSPDPHLNPLETSVFFANKNSTENLTRPPRVSNPSHSRSSSMPTHRP